MALMILSVSLLAAVLRRAMGALGIFLTVIVIIQFGNPSSGGANGVSYLPARGCPSALADGTRCGAPAGAWSGGRASAVRIGWRAYALARGGSAAVGDGDVSVHRHRGFDASLGDRPRGDARRPGRSMTRCCDRRSRLMAGWLFKHTGDGVCAAFGSARAAIDAAVAAQRRWGCRCAWGSPPVRPSVRGRGLLRAGVEPDGPGDGGRSRRPDPGGGVDGGGGVGGRPGRSGRAPLAGPVGCRAPVPGARRGIARSSSRRCGRWTRCRGTCRCRRRSFVGREMAR